MVQFVSPPDWDLVDKLDEGFWEGDNVAGWLCSATVRTEDGAVIDCSNANFENAEARELAVREIVADDRLSFDYRKEIAVMVGKTPVRILD